MATGVTTVTSTAPGNVGYYQFTNLAPGTYSVREVQPANWLDGKDKEGSHGGVATNDLISQIVLDYGDDAVEYNFGELLPGSIRGTVHADPGEDCDFDDPGAHARRRADRSARRERQRARHDVHRRKRRVRIHRPRAGRVPGPRASADEYFDGGERIGTAGGTKYDVAEQFSIFTGINIASGFNAINYDFCEKPPASISGRVHAEQPARTATSTIRSCCSKACAIDLLDADGNVVATTLTNAAGEYEFTGLRKGIYQVREHQPTEYYDGGERIGSAGGVSFDIGDAVQHVHRASCSCRA